ncbi:hypothetical protein MLD38_031870 [Melastoma candidum]|uniref:Uncharacterized protein n=1 Tax=Melastoma candidum TaxID=119954 RepID=A0ACB9MVL7_9MYRT|nr:hypothetical protein MLD38_031870 [Melastoma candidum]
MGERVASDVPSREIERHLLAAAEHLFMAMDECADLSGDARRVISDLQSRLLTKPMHPGRREEFFRETEERLKQSEKVIMDWEASRLMICELGEAERNGYLDAVVEIRRSIESLGKVDPFRIVKQKETFLRAERVLEMAMSRLEEEVKCILGRCKQTYEPRSMSFRSPADNLVFGESFSSVEDNPVDSPRREFEAVDLIRPDMIPVLKAIAKVMFDSDHGPEFCRAFIGARRDALHEYLAGLGMKQLSIEEILGLDWDVLSHEIRNWVRVMWIVTGFYLVSEQNLCNQVLAEFGEFASAAFLDISKLSNLTILNFSKAIVMSSHRPEKLFGVLNMYEVLADRIININALFSEEECSSIRIEFHDFLVVLGDYARATFSAFRNSIESDHSHKPFMKGGVHPLTSYVMNYIKTLCAYRATFDVLFRDEQVCFMCPSLVAEDMTEDEPTSPLDRHLQSILPVLEANLTEKSILLDQHALKHIFLMNNICYMVDKVKGSDDLRCCFGNEWIRKQIAKYQQHATIYLRVTWSCALMNLRESGYAPGSSAPKPRARAREKCRAFCLAFEEVYKLQTGWVIPNPQLRLELQIATSQKVITGYRAFLGMHKMDIDDKYIKYTADDLESLILDFFEGSNRSLPHANSRRRYPQHHLFTNWPAFSNAQKAENQRNFP